MSERDDTMGQVIQIDEDAYGIILARWFGVRLRKR